MLKKWLVGERMRLANSEEKVWHLGGALNHLNYSDKLGLYFEAQCWT